MKWILLTALAVLASGCAGHQKMQTREEWLKTTVRMFPGKTVDEVLVAGEKVLLLADKKDVDITHWPTRMVGQRRWGTFMLIASESGAYTFELSAEPAGDGVKAHLMISTSSQVTGAMSTFTPSAPGSGIGVTANTGPVASAGWNFPHAYDLFWRRMDAILYGRTWATCLGMTEIELSRDQTPINPLCLNASDDLLPGASLTRADFEESKWTLSSADRKRLKKELQAQ